MHIVLLNPEIPQNTGNIARTCAATGAVLDLIKPLGFEISDRYLKRAGLDYWHMMTLRIHENYGAFLDAYPDAELFFLSKKAPRNYSMFTFPKAAFFVFGRESCGLPEELLEQHIERSIRIPMRAGARSLNLSNSVAIIAYEYLRQQSFEGLELSGRLHVHESEGGDWKDYL